MKLCVTALDLDCTYEEQMIFIDDVIRASDKMGDLLDQLEAATPNASE